MVFALVVAVLIGAHRYVPDIAGLGSLADTAAPWFGIAIPLLLVAAAVRRSRWAAAATALPLLIWLIAFGTAWLPDGGGPVQLRVASQNVRADNPTPAATASAVEATGADIIGLQEIGPDAEPAIAGALADTYRYHVSESTVALWSRYPIAQFTGVDLGLSWTRALRADVSTPYGEVTVYVVHLASARAGATATRDSTMRALVDRVEVDTSPRIVLLGDLNTASTDRVLAPLTALLHDTQAAAGTGLGFTWPSGFPLTRPDHVLFRGLRATRAAVVQTPGSDHRAITAGFRF
ncbi:MAG TPA: endonuclease/exonuclease/phosphatase family protein [Micromonosporaceae bacterium]|nr:endonuclease/exonuclease/phosphatase family protein [Micromonosporaceae bacterium]